ncbi:hypothetical protein Bbelb_350660 [Branchiostoma belcheri]|nr:hypothetical protein Bbelb_350660 [Branchiostoma belcheri]
MATASKAVRLVYTDATSTGFGGYVVKLEHRFAQGTWTESERRQSSTWRELQVNDLLADAPLPAYLGRMPTWSRQRRARGGIWFSMEKGGESFEAKMQRAMEANNRATLNSVSTMMDQKLSDMKRSIEESVEAQLSEIKKLKTTKPTFKRKGKEKQYKFYLQATSGRASGRGEGSGEAGKVQKAVQELKKADSYVGA